MDSLDISAEEFDLHIKAFPSFSGTGEGEGGGDPQRVSSIEQMSQELSHLAETFDPTELPQHPNELHQLLQCELAQNRQPGSLPNTMAELSAQSEVFISELDQVQNDILQLPSLEGQLQTLQTESHRNAFKQERLQLRRQQLGEIILQLQSALDGAQFLSRETVLVQQRLQKVLVE